MDTGEVVKDVDTGMRGSDFALMKKSEYFSNIHLKDLWDKEGSVLGKRNKMLELGQDAERIIRNHIDKGNKDIKIDEAVKDMEKAFGTKLSDSAKNHVRKWLRELNLGKQVIFVKTRGGKQVQFTDPSRPTSATGQAIRQIESPKLIEEVYEAEGGKLKKGIAAPLVVFDSVGRSKKNGMSVDVPLDKLVMHFRFTEGMTEAEAIKKKDNLIGNIIK